MIKNFVDQLALAKQYLAKAWVLVANVASSASGGRGNKDEAIKILN